MCTWFSASWRCFRYDRKCLFSCIYNPQITISSPSLFSANFNGNHVKNHPKPWTCPLKLKLKKEQGQWQLNVAQTADHESVQTGENVDWNCWTKVKQNGGLFNSSESSDIVLMLCVFWSDCYVNSKLTPTAERRNALSSLSVSEHESVMCQCHHTGHRFVFLGVGWSKIETTAFWMTLHL